MDVQLLEATTEPERLICKAARNDYLDAYVAEQSFEETMAPVDGDTLEAKMETLIGHLMDRGHFGPFEHPTATFAMEGISRSCMAQLTRHRLASFDIQSMRYVSFDDVDPADVEQGEMVVVPPSVTDPEWVGRNQAAGTVDPDTVAEREQVYRSAMRDAFQAYNDLLDLGMAPEDARFVLPLASKVNIVMTVNARMLMHIADMRAAADAQWEIRELTESILDLAEEWCPITFAYYNEHLKHRKNRLSP